MSTLDNADPPNQTVSDHMFDFPLIVNDRPFAINDDDPSGRDIRATAYLNPASAFILIEIRGRGATSLGLDDKIKLRRDQTAVFRAFESDRLFSFTLNERGWEWGAETIQENELRHYGEVPDDHDIVLDKTSDEVIERGAMIALTGKGTEQFITRLTPPREVTIRVNGRKRIVPAGLITYETVICLAFPDAVSNPDIIYTVGFRHGGSILPEGSLVAGQSVKASNGMIFNATPTNRS